MLAKSNVNGIKFLISKTLVDRNISQIYDEFILLNNVLKELYHMKKRLKNYNNKLYIKQFYLNV